MSIDGHERFHMIGFFHWHTEKSIVFRLFILIIGMLFEYYTNNMRTPRFKLQSEYNKLSCVKDN